MTGFVRDHISLYANIDLGFNSLSEDHQGFGREQVFHCNGMLKATKKSISLLQSKYLSIKTIDCII